MNRIEVLDSRTIDSIAAGEVVERPASVLKELVENSIDAGASVITVEIKNGGKTFLRVTDDGSGIEKEQIRLAFTRHATSKIRTIDDLPLAASLGFRGEALSSIAAVSKVEVITRTKDEISGIRYRIAGGAEESLEEIGAPFGTTFIMRELFYNTPAREKFLKSDVSETNAVASIMEQLALSHPGIAFTFIADGRQKLYTSGFGDLLECAYRIYGKDITNKLIPVHFTSELIRIDGYCGLPEISRGNKNFENYFINGRYVKDRIVSSAIEEAYHGHLMQHRYPFTLLNIHIDPLKVDVNVHPAKMEVRFSNQSEIFEEIRECLSMALTKNEEIPSASITEENKKEKASFLSEGPAVVSISVKPAATMPETAYVPKKKPDPVLTAPQPFEEKRLEKVRDIQASMPVPELVREKQLSIFDDVKAKPEIRFKLIGQVFDTYVLVEYEDKFYIIDQHAAHEKVMYEKFMKEFNEQSITTQYLMPAKLITLTAAQNDLFRENLEIFRSMGYEIEHFEGREWKITGVPTNLYVDSIDEFFKDLLDSMGEEGKISRMIPERIATRACKAAVKGNMHLSFLEIQALIKDLLSLDDPYHCPHGRPTIISMTHYELDKKFKRIL